jgi:hypothetical protein
MTKVRNQPKLRRVTNRWRHFTDSKSCQIIESILKYKNGFKNNLMYKEIFNATSADSVPSSYLVRITIAPIGTTFGNLQWRRYWNNFTFEYSSNNNIFSEPWNSKTSHFRILYSFPSRISALFLLHTKTAIGKPRASPLLFLNTSAVIRYLICVYASHFFVAPTHSSQLRLLPYLHHTSSVLR